MKEQLISQILQGVGTIILALIGYGVRVACNYIKAKEQEVIASKGATEYNHQKGVAFDIYHLLEEEFKFIPKSGELKLEQFNKLLLAKFPKLTQEDLDHFRQAVVGVVNATVNETGILKSAPVFDPKIDSADVTTVEPLVVSTSTKVNNLNC